MAIRKAGGTGGVKKTRKVDQEQLQQPQKKAPAEAIKELRQDLAQATAPGVGRSQWLSEAEVSGLLDKAKAAGPEAQKALQQDLKAALETGQIGGNELKLGDAALQKVAAFTGVAAGTYRTAVQDKDKEAEHTLAEGLAKTKTEVSQEDTVATKNQLDELKLQGQTGAKVSKAEFTPHYQAAKVIGDELKKAGSAYLEENNPAAKAAVDQVGPQVESMIAKTASRITADPEASRRVAGVLSQVGSEGFAQAMKEAGPDVAKAFTEATGVRAVNPGVVGPMLENMPKLAQRVAPEAAPKVAETCAKLAGKLGLEGAEAAVSAGAKAGGKAVAKEGAEAAAKAGAKTATSGSKAVPGLGNMVSAGCACLAGVGLIKSLTRKPRDGEGIAKNGLNTLLQTVGIAFPWVGLAGDLVDMGWSAKKAVSDQQKGKAPEPTLDKKEAAGLVGDPARLLASALAGAGQPGAAKAFTDLADVTEQAADKKEIERHQVSAFSQLSQVANQEIGKAAAQESDPATRDAMNTVSHGFGELFKVLYQHKKMGGDDGAKRGDIKGQLARITGDVAMGMAAMKVGGKDATLDVLDQQARTDQTQADQMRADQQLQDELMQQDQMMAG